MIANTAERVSDELKPCPFCGSDAGEAMWPKHVGCTNKDCGAYRANLPIAAWNRRSEGAGEREAVEAARSLLKANTEIVESDGGYCEYTRLTEIVCKALLTTPSPSVREEALEEALRRIERRASLASHSTAVARDVEDIARAALKVQA